MEHVAFDVEGQEAVCRRELEPAQPPVRRRLDEQDAHDAVLLDEHRAPATAADAIGDRPRDAAAPREEAGAGTPNWVTRADGRQVGTPSASSVSAHRSAAERSSPASPGDIRPRTRTSRLPYSRSTVPRSRTRARSSPAAYGMLTSRSTQSDESSAAISALSVSSPKPVSALTRTVPAR